MLTPIFVTFFIWKVATYELALEHIDGHNIVWDIKAGALCYPYEEQEHLSRNKPMSHHDWGLHAQDTETLVTKAAKVMCRQLGYTHLKRAYKVVYHQNQESEFSRTSWNATCFGFEPLLQHCVVDEYKPSECSYILAIDCDNCYEKKVLKLGATEVINSPGFPNKVLYPDDAICTWHLEAESTSIFRASFSHFSLPRPDDNGICSRGALSFEGYISYLNRSAPILPFCGNREITSFSLVANTLVIRFTSGLFHPRPMKPGFLFNVTLLEYTAVSAAPVPYKPDIGEITAIVLGAILLIVVGILCCMVHRFHNSTKYAKNRNRMEERVAVRQQTTIRRSGIWNTLQHVSTIHEETHSLNSAVTLPAKDHLCMPTSQDFDSSSGIYMELDQVHQLRKQSQSNSSGQEYIPVSTNIPMQLGHHRTNDKHLNTPKTPKYSTIQKPCMLNRQDSMCGSPNPPPVAPRNRTSLSPRPHPSPRRSVRRSQGSRTQSPALYKHQRCSTLKGRTNLSLSLWNIKPVSYPNVAKISAHDKSVSEPNLLVLPQIKFSEGRLKRISQYFSPNCLHSSNALEENGRQRVSSNSLNKARDIFSSRRKRMGSLASASSYRNGYNRLGNSASNILQIPLQTDDPDVVFEE